MEKRHQLRQLNSHCTPPQNSFILNWPRHLAQTREGKWRARPGRGCGRGGQSRSTPCTAGLHHRCDFEDTQCARTHSLSNSHKSVTSDETDEHHACHVASRSFGRFFFVAVKLIRALDLWEVASQSGPAPGARGAAGPVLSEKHH